MGTAVVVDATVKDGRLVIVDESFYRTRIERMAKKWGDGSFLKVRIEPADEATRHGQYKHYYGHLIAPVVEHTGDTDWHSMLKAMFMPDGKTSLTELNYDEFDHYIKAVEQYLYLRIPEAFEGEQRGAA